MICLGLKSSTAQIDEVICNVSAVIIMCCIDGGTHLADLQELYKYLFSYITTYHFLCFAVPF